MAPRTINHEQAILHPERLGMFRIGLPAGEIPAVEHLDPALAGIGSRRIRDDFPEAGGFVQRPATERKCLSRR